MCENDQLPELTIKEIKDISKSYIQQNQHEDKLLNQRLSWLIISQTFLILPYINTLQLEQSHKSQLIGLVLGIFGILSSLFVLSGVIAAQLSITIKDKEYQALSVQYKNSECIKEWLKKYPIRPQYPIEAFGILTPFLIIISINLLWVFLSSYTNYLLFVASLYITPFSILLSMIMIVSTWLRKLEIKYFIFSFYIIPILSIIGIIFYIICSKFYNCDLFNMNNIKYYIEGFLGFLFLLITIFILNSSNIKKNDFEVNLDKLINSDRSSGNDFQVRLDIFTKFGIWLLFPSLLVTLLFFIIYNYIILFFTHTNGTIDLLQKYFVL